MRARLLRSSCHRFPAFAILAFSFRRQRLGRRADKLDAMNSHDIVRYLLLLLSVSLLLFATALAEDNTGSTSSTVNTPKPPATKQQPVTDDYCGHKVVDPYRWLEDG